MFSISCENEINLIETVRKLAKIESLRVNVTAVVSKRGDEVDQTAFIESCATVRGTLEYRENDGLWFVVVNAGTPWLRFRASDVQEIKMNGDSEWEITISW